MAETSTAPKNMFTPENLSIKPTPGNEPASAEPQSRNESVSGEPDTHNELASVKTQVDDEPAPLDLHTRKEPSMVKFHAHSELASGELSTHNELASVKTQDHGEPAPMDLDTRQEPSVGKLHAQSESASGKFNELTSVKPQGHDEPASFNPHTQNEPTLNKSHANNETSETQMHEPPPGKPQTQDELNLVKPRHSGLAPVEPHTYYEPALVKSHAQNDTAPLALHTRCNKVGAGVQTTNEPSLVEFQSKKKPDLPQSQYEDPRRSSDVGTPVKLEPKIEDLVKVKDEVDDGIFTSGDKNLLGEEKPLLGKLKIKPMASLVETSMPNPQPGLHPFFAGFDDHIRSLIMNRQPQFSMNPPLVQRSPQFMYYDNTTNMNLKKMLNGHKMAQVTPSRHPTFRPYVPINVPRPPRTQPFRHSFSTQTPPMFVGQPEVGATPSTQTPRPFNQPDSAASPSTSYMSGRPPRPNFTPQNSPAPQNFKSLKNISVPSFTPNTSQNTKTIFPSSTTFESTLTPKVTQNFPPVRDLTIPYVAPAPNKVSTSSSTDDLEKHSSENVIIKTEVDLGIDSKEELHSTLNECNEIEPHFMDVDSSKTSGSPDKPQIPILTGDDVTPPVKDLKLSPEYILPTYSTKGSLLCKCCNFRCNRKKKMKEHMDALHTAENRFKCFYCVKKLLPIVTHKGVRDLEHHVAKVHRGEKRWQCKYCSKTYKCQASYKSHMEKTCSQSHPYACHMCTFTCVTEYQLEKHIKSHQKIQETQVCPFCNKTFKKLYMKQHLISIHAPPEEKPFHCVSCDFAAAAQTTLENHYKRSGHDKQFKCNMCDYACHAKSLLKSHIECVHQKTEPDKFVCGIDGCKVRLPHARSLKVHRQMHSMPDSELFICPDKLCAQKFASEQSLRYHTTKTKHHKPFKCSDCTHRFLKEESLNKHIQTVHVVKILKDMEKSQTSEKVCVKNVVDVFNYVESSSANNAESGEALQNFGCWLGISGFGDIANKTDCDNQAEDDISDGKREEEEEAKKVEEDDAGYETLVPITCLVELKHEETEDPSNSSVGKTDIGETLILKKEEQEEDEDDSEYQHVNPDISCLVECQQNTTADSSTNCTDADYLSTDLVKVDVEEGDAS